MQTTHNFFLITMNSIGGEPRILKNEFEPAAGGGEGRVLSVGVKEGLSCVLFRAI